MESKQGLAGVKQKKAAVIDKLNKFHSAVLIQARFRGALTRARHRIGAPKSTKRIEPPKPVAVAHAPALSVWPPALSENFSDRNWPKLSDSQEALAWVQKNKKVFIRVITWNMCGEGPPPVEDTCKILLPGERFHMYLIGTEECERSIARSAMNPSKKNWETYLLKALGPNYVPIRSHTLQAIHLMCFAHKAIAMNVHSVSSAAVATGLGNTLGNKGGVGIHFSIGNTTFVVVNAHCSAHQNAVKQRNNDCHRICSDMPLLLSRRNATRVQSLQRSAAETVKSGLRAFSDLAAQLSDDQVIQQFDAKHEFEDKASPPGDDDSPNIGLAALLEMDERAAATAQDGTGEAEVGGSGGGSGLDRLGASALDLGLDFDVDDKSAKASPRDGSGPHELEKAAEKAVERVVDSKAVDKAAGAAQKAVTASPPAHLNTSSLSQAVAEPKDPQHHRSVVSSSAAAPVVSGVKDVAGDGDGEEVEEEVFDRSTKEGMIFSKLAKCRQLKDCADRVVFMGDLNYRINGKRPLINKLLHDGMHEVLLEHDQLRKNLHSGSVLNGFIEGPLNFRPTYRFDIDSDEYDTGPKKRLPAWTDRILYVDRGIECWGYNAEFSLRSSDHRPVFATLVCEVDLPAVKHQIPIVASSAVGRLLLHPDFRSESQVCSIM